MKIINMTKLKDPKGQTRAFFSIETKTVVYNGMRLMAGEDGQLYAHYPAYEYVSGGRKRRAQWYVFKELAYLEAISEAAREKYKEIK
jgi:hypothetical protein